MVYTEARREACKRYHEKNRERRLAMMREHYEKNREELAAKSKEYYHQHIEERRAYDRQRRPGKKNQAAAEEPAAPLPSELPAPAPATE